MLVIELSTRMGLLLAVTFTSVCVLFLGHSVKDVENYIINGVKKSAFVVTILLVIGCVIGAWIASGIIPTIIYYGLETLNPTIFMVGGLISCSLVSYFTGSSYACVGTLGVALMGIGQGLGLPLPLTAGMIISGAMFGDKMSPFSDTTNLSAGTAGVSIYVHIRSMTYTTVPALLIAAALFFYLGLEYSSQKLNTNNIEILQQTIKTHFTITPILLAVPFLTIFLAAKKTPPVIAMAFGAITGMIAAFIFQDGFETKILFMSVINGLSYDFGSADVNNLLASRGGLTSMLLAVTIAMMALVMGELLTRAGVLKAIIKGLEKTIVNTAGLVVCSIVSCLSVNMLSASQYIAIVLPGTTLKPLYEKRGVSRRVLSRSLEDGGTMLSVAVPWAGDAIFVATTLGVATLSYLPYAYFIILCPLFSIFFAIIGYAVWTDADEKPEEAYN